jgi:hypothetical protein
MDFLLLILMAFIFVGVYMSPLWILAYFKNTPYMKRMCLKSFGILLYMVAIQFYCFAFLIGNLIND